MSNARNLANLLGTNTTVQAAKIAAVNTSAMPSGSVLQVVQSVSDSYFNPGTGGGTWIDTGFNVSITPTSTSNKVLISFSSHGIIRGADLMGIKLERGSTEIWSGDGYSNDDSYWQMANYGFSYLDSPATTSATTYTIYAYAGTITASKEFRMNYRGGTSGDNPKSVLIAQEIAG